MTDQSEAVPFAAPAPGAATAPGLALARRVASQSLPELFAGLTAERMTGVLSLLEWICSPGQRRAEIGGIVEELCERLVRAGVPLDRYGSSTTMVTADHDAIGRVWQRDKGVEELVYVIPETGNQDYLDSPFRASADSGQWVELWLPETSDDAFGIVPNLKAAGFVHYLCVPMWLSNGASAW